MDASHSFQSFSDTKLTEELGQLVHAERSVTARLVAALAEFDARRLYLAIGYKSLFDYCVRYLKLSEDATFNRIEAARAARRFPMILDLLESGALSLTGARLLAPHLTAENHAALLDESRNKTKKEIELVVARLKPQPPVPSILRKLPETRAAVPMHAVQQMTVGESAHEMAGTAPAMLTQEEPASTPWLTQPSRRPIMAPLSDAQYKLQVTISKAGHDRLRQIQDLMRHNLPNGDPAVIVERALELLHRDLLKKKAGQVARPRPAKHPETKGRQIPASVKREVWQRDEGRCAFKAPDGTRCAANGLLEYHHIDPYWLGGEASVANIELRCRAHNRLAWEMFIADKDREGEEDGPAHRLT